VPAISGFHLGPQAGTAAKPPVYSSTTALGQQIAALIALWNAIAAVTTTGMSDSDAMAINLAKQNLQGELSTSLNALIALDQELQAYDQQMAVYTQKCQAALETTAPAPGGAAAAAPPPSPQNAPGVPIPAAAGIGVLATALGGIIGFGVAKYLDGRKEEEKE